MLKVWVECVKVLGNISIVKWQSVAFIVQQDTNLCGGNSNSDVWCHPTVQEFILVPVGKKHSQKYLMHSVHRLKGLFSCFACMVKTVLSFPRIASLCPIPIHSAENAVHCFSTQPYPLAHMCLPHPCNRPSYPHLAENEQVLSLRTGEGQRDFPFFPATELYLKMSFPLRRSCALPGQLGLPQSNTCLLLSLAAS